MGMDFFTLRRPRCFNKLSSLGVNYFLFPFHKCRNHPTNMINLAFFIQHQLCPWYLNSSNILIFVCSFVHLPFLFLKIAIVESHTTFFFCSSLALLDGKDFRRVDGQFHYKGVKKKILA